MNILLVFLIVPIIFIVYHLAALNCALEANALASSILNSIFSTPTELSGIAIDGHERRILRKHGKNNTMGIHILPIPKDFTVEPPWSDVKIPKTSFFLGLEPPTNSTKWEIAKLQASRGEQILLQRVLDAIKSPTDLITGDTHFRWVQRLIDVFVVRDQGAPGLAELKNYRGHRAPIACLGRKNFDRPNFEGTYKGYNGFGPDNLLNNRPWVIPRKMVGVGLMDENWGWLSTYIHNRTISWAVTLAPNGGLKDLHKTEQLSGMAVMSKFLDDPNLIMLAVNQHHNFTNHPKVISFPLGIKDRDEIFHATHRVARQGLKKDMDFFSASSSWGPRPQLIKCIRKKMGSYMESTTVKIPANQFRLKLVTSRVVLCMPGLGYDTYRLWETLAAGSVPVIERGVGLDRTLWKLPALLVDDFADLTPELIRGAYVEALYRADEWEYERITQRWWERLLFRVSEAGNTEELLKLHPMKAVDESFIRPLWPFDCSKGCGPGMKRIPKEMCLMNSSTNLATYKWHIWA
eukprot:CAMPEP_0182416270 /NCGR_PEP_ID=MMETSP1167-20130531/528_1 /TAXON_ID=2988 /ORGANISM="Mallomonas Sp, Strain CCMP3275" /LENGTH=518 /DNA_ID=CAMNT_0024588887 /DNA_START=129 /DNA_END=1685 /DNA_ORIENTATION=-